jgi:AraC-like DNA-binding protein
MDQTPYPKAYLYRRVVQSKLFIDEHFAENIDVGCISDQAYFSKFHFIRLFKSIYGKPPHQYLIHVRVEQAKQFLAEGVSVTEVCFAVGFDSIGSFSRLFKKIVRMTPTAYQQRERAMRMQIAATPLKFIPGCFAGGGAPGEKAILKKQ